MIQKIILFISIFFIVRKLIIKRLSKKFKELISSEEN